MKNVKSIAFYSVSGGSYAEFVAEPQFLQRPVGSGVPAGPFDPPAAARADPSGGRGEAYLFLVNSKLETRN